MHLNEEHTLIQDTARRFAQEQLALVADEVGRYSADHQQTPTVFLQNLKRLAELGFMGLTISGDYGGSETDSVSYSLVITEVAKVCASTAVTLSVTNMVAEIIDTVGNDEQRQRYLPKLCQGEYPAGAFCLTEAHAGSDPASMRTQARLDKDSDTWVINGSKQWITSAAYAGILVVWAVTDPEAPKGKGISCFLVEADTPGIRIDPGEHKMGQHGSSTNNVHFEQCRVSSSNMLGDLHQGFKIAVGELAGGRIGIGSLALGVGLAAMDYARQYLQEREQFGKPLAEFQGLQWQLADAYTDLTAAQLLLIDAAERKDRGEPYATAASMAKLFASEKANRACYTAQQMLGGNGYMQDFPLERYARDVRITTIYEGTSEIQRLIIARDLLR